MDEKEKIDLVQIYLGANKSTISYEDAKRAVKKAYQQFRKPGLIDHLYNQPSSPPLIPALQSELVTLLQRLQILQATPPRDNPFYPPNYANANIQDQNSRVSIDQGIYCHNYRKKSYYSTSCTRLGAQRTAKRKAIHELQRGSCHYPQGPSQALAPLFVSAAPVVIASGRGERKKPDGQKMNNIWGANVVILKRPTVEEADDHFEYYPLYPIISATSKQKSAAPKFIELKQTL